jgi:purine-binding chemotaxis protein CheW
MDENKNKGIKKFLVFKLCSEEYGLDIQKITTIIEKDMNIARVPKTPAFLKGVVNLRGDIIPVISLRKRFKLPDVEYTEETRIIIVKLDEIIIGLIVDSIAEVVELEDESIENITDISGELSLDYITGVGKAYGRIITLLNLEKLISLTEEA